MILFLIILVSILFIIGAFCMTLVDNCNDRVLAIINLVCFALVMVCFCLIANLKYKEGQIDSINGKIKYELKANSDGSSSWREIKEERWQ